MRRHLPGLGGLQAAPDLIVEGLYLVRVEHAAYRHNGAKPYLSLRFKVLAPVPCAGREFPARFYCSKRALWRLAWFLRDFGYDEELLEQEEVDEKRLLGLQGIVKLSPIQVNHRMYLNLECFASQDRWEELSSLPETQPAVQQ